MKPEGRERELYHTQDSHHLVGADQGVPWLQYSVGFILQTHQNQYTHAKQTLNSILSKGT